MTTAAEILTATYDRADATARVVVRFYADDSIEFATVGTVTDDEVFALARAEGAAVAGWLVSLS